MRKSLLRSLVLALSLFTLSGCGIIDMVYLPPPEDTAQELFESGNEAMSEKNYVRAAELYIKLRDAFPFSPYTLEAELALADCYYLDKEYILAAESYKDFESMHPRHEAIPYVLYQTGMSLLGQFISIDRATTEVQEAYDYFNRLLQTYPDTPYAKNANYADVPDVTDHAREKAQAAYLYYREEQADEQRQMREGTWKNWFKWL